MGKIILEFDTTEQQDEINDAINGWKWRAALWDIDQELRSTTKHGVSQLNRNEEASDIEYQTAEKYRELIRDIISNYGLTINP